MPIEQTKDNGRLQMLRQILNHERNLAMARIQDYRRDQEDEATPPPGDEMDAARSLADVETHATLIERAEDRLKAIDFAFDRLEQGRYGICAQCGEEIPLERLKALPFAGFCVDCQQNRNHLSRSGKPWIDEPFIHKWDLPEEMAETTETSHDELVQSSGEGEMAVPRSLSSPRAGGPAKKRPKARTRRSRGD